MKISVIIPLYNKKNHIQRTLTSVLDQTFQDIEVVIVNDGSTDDSVQVVQRIDDSRIRLIHQSNAGVSAARNRGVKEAGGEWIAFLDADDTWHPEKLEKQIAWLKQYPDAMWASCGFSRTRVPGQIKNVEKFHSCWFKETCLLEDGLIPLSCGRHFWTGTVMVKKRVFETVQPFDTSLRTGEDLDFFYRLVCRFPDGVYLPECLAYYHTGISEALTSTMDRFPDAASVLLLPQRFADYGKNLPAHRKTLATNYAGRVLQIRLYNLIIRKKYSLAKEVLIEAEKAGLTIHDIVLKLRVWFPWLASFDLKLKIKQIVKMLAIRGGGGYIDEWIRSDMPKKSVSGLGPIAV